MTIGRRTFLAGMFIGVGWAANRAAELRSLEQAIFAATNRERRARGRPALSWSDALAGEARKHSARMMRGGFFGHSDPAQGNLADRLRAAGIRYNACAENLYQSTRLPDGASVVAVWMRSRGHRSNLLSKTYREIGVGVATDSNGRYMVTQLFIA